MKIARDAKRMFESFRQYPATSGNLCICSHLNGHDIQGGLWLHQFLWRRNVSWRFFQCFSFTWNITRPSSDSSDDSIQSASNTLDLSLRMPSFKRVGPWSSFNCQSARCINLDTSQQRLPKIGQRVDTALSQSASLRLHTDSESERNS